MFARVLTKLGLYNFDFREFVVSILWAAVIAVLFRTFLFEPFKIPSGSMIPNLQVGDYLFTSKYSYGYSKYSMPFNLPVLTKRVLFTQPKIGDVIVFKGIKDPDTFYIKRLIGLPGDVIQLKSGVVYINGEEIKRNRLGTYTKVGEYGESKIFDVYTEKLPNGVEYKVLDANINNHADFPDQTIKYKVPEGHYFFMGDNRNNSIDSRYLNEIGFVPQDHLVGRAEYIFWSSDFSILDFITSLKTGRAFSAI